MRIALCFGLTVATIAATIGHVSGCHVNPAVTVGLMLGAKVGWIGVGLHIPFYSLFFQIGLLKGLLYICCQCSGAIIGSHVLYLFLYESTDLRGASGLGATGLHPDVSAAQVCHPLFYFGGSTVTVSEIVSHVTAFASA